MSGRDTDPRSLPAPPDGSPGGRTAVPGPSRDSGGGPFALGDGAALVIWTFLAQFVVGVVFAPLTLMGLDLTAPALSSMLILSGSVVTLAGALGWLRLRGRLDWRLLGAAVPAPRHLLQGVGAGMVGLVVVFGYQYGLDQLIGPLPPPQQSILELIQDGGVITAVVAITVAVALAPVVEEVVFRGVLFRAFERRWRLWPALTASAVVFALAHVELYLPPFASQPSPAALGALVLLAAWLAGVFVWSRSLVVPTVAHGVFNGAVILLAMVVG